MGGKTAEGDDECTRRAHHDAQWLLLLTARLVSSRGNQQMASNDDAR